jgi:chromosome segregation ATPase
MLKVRVQNFQSIKDSIIEIDGFTVITGANNSGKSAFVRALRGLFTNARGHHFVRTGATHCSVTIIFPDAQTVTWEKGKNVNRYIVNGKVLDKVGIGVPPEVQAFGVVPVTLAGQEYWPQIASQFSGQVFLIDQPGSVLAEAVSDIEKVSKLNKALKQAESDKRENNSKLAIRNADLKKSEAELLSYSGLDIVEELYKQIEALNTKATNHKNGINYINEKIAGLKLIKDKINILSWSESFSFAEYDNLSLNITKISTQITDVKRLASGVRASRGIVDTLQGPLDSPALGILAESHSDLVSLSSQTEQLKSLNNKLVTARKAVKVQEDKLISLTIPDTDKVSKVASAFTVVGNYKTNIDRYRADVTSLEASLKKQESQLDLLTKDISKTLKDLGHCPTCGTVCAKELAHG